MKHLLIALVAMFVFTSLAFAQHGTGSSLKTGGTQGVVSGMVGGPHDFTKTNYTGDTTTRSFKGASTSLCSYCHSMKIPADGIPTPLWNRKSLAANGTTATFGQYSSISMDATTADVTSDDNYSSYCLTCHDGTAIFAASKYSKPLRPGTPGTPGFDTLTVSSGANFSTTGEWGGLSHVHPVNMSYATAAATDAGLWPAPAVTQNYMVWDATYGAVGRLFGPQQTVQCSSCHNPHNNNKGILLEGSSSYGALCVSCHKK